MALVLDEILDGLMERHLDVIQGDRYIMDDDVYVVRQMIGWIDSTIIQ